MIENQKDNKILQEDFFAQINGLLLQNKIFNHLPDIYLFVKNFSGQFIEMNDSFVQMCGKNCKNEIIGLKDSDIFAPHLAEGYMKDDRQVLDTGRDVINRIELNPAHDGSITWMETTKTPIHSSQGNIIGLMGIARDMKKTQLSLKPYQEMSEVMEYILENFSTPIQVKDLAKMCHLSISQFERNFKKNFHDNPIRFIVQLRIKAACDLLIHSHESISEIAHKTGFYDHSSFTRHFVKYFNCLPKDYRKKNQVHYTKPMSRKRSPP